MTKTLLFAGGNSGIGLETVNRLRRRQRDTRIICAVRNPGPLSDMEGVETVPFDAADSDLTGIDFPESLDGFVYFPGTITLKPFQRVTDEDFLNDWQINFLGAARLLRACLPALKKANRAAVVFFSTVAAGTGLPFHTSISAAKGALESFARSLAAELAPGIRVNVIAPSLTDTALSSSLLNSDDKREASKKRHPLQQIGDPVGIAAAVEFLLSDESKFMTGQVVGIDGGISRLRLL